MNDDEWIDLYLYVYGFISYVRYFLGGTCPCYTNSSSSMYCRKLTDIFSPISLLHTVISFAEWGRRLLTPILFTQGDVVGEEQLEAGVRKV